MANRNTRSLRTKTAKHGNLVRGSIAIVRAWRVQWHKEHGIEHNRSGCK